MHQQRDNKIDQNQQQKVGRPNFPIVVQKSRWNSVEKGQHPSRQTKQHYSYDHFKNAVEAVKNFYQEVVFIRSKWKSGYD